MKPIHLVLPLAALAINGAILYWQEDEREHLRERIEFLRAALHSAPDDGPERSKPAVGSTAPPGKSAGPVDLVEVARKFAEEADRDEPDPAFRDALRREIGSLSDRERLDLMEKCLTIDMPGNRRLGLLNLLADGLGAGADPEEVVRLYSRLTGESMEALEWGHRALSGFVRRWAKRDPEAVVRWIDDQEAKGFFRMGSLGRVNSFRVSVEAALLSRLLVTNPDPAAARLEAMGDRDRLEAIFALGAIPLDANERRAVVGALREFVPEENRQRVWRDLVNRAMREGDLSDAKALMTGIDASSDERIEIATLALGRAIGRLDERESGGLTLGNTAELRSWIAEQVPGGASEALGRALAAKALGRSREILNFVRELHAAEPSDVMVYHFLMNYFKGKPNDAPALQLANGISDPEMRARAQKRLRTHH